MVDDFARARTLSEEAFFLLEPVDANRDFHLAAPIVRDDLELFETFLIAAQLGETEGDEEDECERDQDVNGFFHVWIDVRMVDVSNLSGTVPQIAEIFPCSNSPH